MRDGFLADHRRHAVERADRFFARYGAAKVSSVGGSRASESSRPSWQAEVDRTVRHAVAHHLGYTKSGVAVLGL